MQIYEYVTWKLENKDLSFRYIFGKEKARNIENSLSKVLYEGFSYKIVELSDQLLDIFFNKVYKPFILSKKINPRIIDIPNRIREGKEVFGKKYYIGYIEKDGNMVAGGIYSFFRNQDGKNILTLGFRAYENIKINKIGLGYFIEYLYFKLGFDLKVDYFSRGKDKNGYGALGSSPTLPVHKLQLKFFPFLPKEEIYTQLVDIENPHKERDVLFFSDPDDAGKFRKVNLITNKNKEDISLVYGIFSKRELLFNVYDKHESL